MKKTVWCFILCVAWLTSCSPATTVPPIPQIAFTQITLSPTKTPTPSLTPTSSQTPTPKITGTPPGLTTGLEFLSDGSVHFVDYEANFELSVPKGWTVISLDPKNDQTTSTKIPGLEKMLEQVHGLELSPSIFIRPRLYAFDARGDYSPGDYRPNIQVLWIANPYLTSVNINELLKQALRLMPILQPGSKVTAHDAGKTEGDLEIGVVESVLPYPLNSETTLQLYQQTAFFSTGWYAAAVMLQAPTDAKDAAQDSFKWVMDSVKVIPP